MCVWSSVCRVHGMHIYSDTFYYLRLNDSWAQDLIISTRLAGLQIFRNLLTSASVLSSGITGTSTQFVDSELSFSYPQTCDLHTKPYLQSDNLLSKLNLKKTYICYLLRFGRTPQNNKIFLKLFKCALMLLNKFA